MKFRIYLDWNEHCGVSLEKMYELRDLVTQAFDEKSYDGAIERMDIFIVCWETAVLYRKILNLHSRGLRCRILLPFRFIAECRLPDKLACIQKHICEQLLQIEIHAGKKRVVEGRLLGLVREAFESAIWSYDTIKNKPRKFRGL